MRKATARGLSLLCSVGMMCAAAAAELSYPELEACMRAKVAALSLTRKVDDERAALDQLKRALLADEDTLAQARTGLDRRDAAAVAAYNQRVEGQDSAGRAFNARVAAFNADTIEATRLAHDYAGRCAERPFKAEDVERLPDELRAAAHDGGVVDVDDYARARQHAGALR